jgi:dipeptidyl aminopeptidase/acylaminoacyl peptidase
MVKSLCYFYLALTYLNFSNGNAQSHAFTVKDDIAMVRFNDPSGSYPGAAAKFSHDGRYFAVVTSRGVIESDQIESVLSVFSAGETEAFVTDSGKSSTAPPAQIVIKMAAVLSTEQSSAYGAIITDLRWSSDSNELYFLAETQHFGRRLYRVDVDRDETVPITPEGYNVVRFDVYRDLVVYSAWQSDRAKQTAEQNGNGNINSDARDITGEPLRNVLFPEFQPAPTDRELWLVRDSRGHTVVKPLPRSRQRDISWLPEAFTISPKGRMMIHLRSVDDVPSNWSQYDPANGFEYLRIHPDDPDIVSPANIWRLKEYSLVDLDGGDTAILVNAPQSYALAYAHDSRVVWAPDEKRVLLTNTFLPLIGVDDTERAKRLKPCAVADVQLPSREMHCIVFVSDLAADPAGSLLADSLSFSGTDDVVDFRVSSPQGGEQRRRYVYEKDAWRLSVTDVPARHVESGDGTDGGGIKVTIKQGLNEPPTLWGTDLRSGQSKKLWDPNPQFRNLAFGEASTYQWQDRNGSQWRGGLIKPVGYAPGKHYPLVIQIYDFYENEFITDGTMPTAFAARAIASAGIVVLQVQRKLPHSFNMSEADAQLGGFQSAIEKLSREGLVDPSQVGLVGFSSTCWYVERALIKDPMRFKAATIADGIDISYMQYHLWGVSSPPLEREFERIIGSKPTGDDGLKQWFELAPGFHLDRIVAPLRIEAISPSSLLGEWEIYSSLRQERKPVDLIYFPEGQHIHQRPLERLASQQGDVDWFRFWLQGFEDPDPSKRGQYKQWEKMRILNVPVGETER